MRIDTAVDVDDLIQAGYMGLVEAERTYDASKGKSWAGWAAWHVKNAMAVAVGIKGTRERAHLHAVSLDAPLSDEEGAASLLDTLADESIPDASTRLVEAERAATVRAAVDRLAGDRREVVRRHDLDGMSYAKTGEGMGISAEAVRGIRVKALRDLRRDWKLRRLLDEETRFYQHKGVSAFNTDWTSVTEAAALWRIEHSIPQAGLTTSRGGVPKGAEQESTQLVP